ncbi:hypothetical protein AcV5_006765 [Taiwanofungus camphoratus]|nr:hypothetical protein AcV5_006765 [Antrodia cinnamomea]
MSKKRCPTYDTIKTYLPSMTLQARTGWTSFFEQVVSLTNENAGTAHNIEARQTRKSLVACASLEWLIISPSVGTVLRAEETGWKCHDAPHYCICSIVAFARFGLKLHTFYSSMYPV